MIRVDVSMPKRCLNCLMSCRMPDNTILCRYDMDKHIPGDDKCPIVKDETENDWIAVKNAKEDMPKDKDLLITAQLSSGFREVGRCYYDMTEWISDYPLEQIVAYMVERDIDEYDGPDMRKKGV